MKHAVPMNEAAVARLSHRAMTLDVYTWLANRLHRVDPNKHAFVPWVAETEGLDVTSGRKASSGSPQ